MFVRIRMYSRRWRAPALTSDGLSVTPASSATRLAEGDGGNVAWAAPGMAHESRVMKTGSDPQWVRSELDSDTEGEKLVPLEGTEPASDAQPFLWTMSSGPTPACPDTSGALFEENNQPPLTQEESGYTASVKYHFS